PLIVRYPMNSNPTALPQSYTRNLIVLEATVLVVTAAAALVCRLYVSRRRNRRQRVQGTDLALSSPGPQARQGLGQQCLRVFGSASFHHVGQVRFKGPLGFGLWRGFTVGTGGQSATAALPNFRDVGTQRKRRLRVVAVGAPVVDVLPGDG